MERLEEQFEGALARIEVSGSKRDRAIKAHEEMRGVLEADPKLRERGRGGGMSTTWLVQPRATGETRGRVVVSAAQPS